MMPERTLRLLSLCAGIGAIDYVWSHILGQEIAGQIEIDPFCQAILSRHWPDVPRYADIHDVRGDEFGTIDLMAGGIPCQPFSFSGKRRGTEDDRYLWTETFRLVRSCQPRWVLIENVAGFLSLALDLVCADLESEDYLCRAIVLPACAVGASHIRERVFVVAHATGCGCYIGTDTAGNAMQPDASGTKTLAHAALFGRPAWRPELQGQRRTVQPDGHGTSCMAHTGSDRRREWTYQQEYRDQCERTSDARLYGKQGHLAYSNCQRCKELNIAAITGGTGQHSRSLEAYPSPGQAQSRLGRDADGFASWLDSTCWPAPPGEQQYAWEPSRTVVGSDRDRAKRLKALGNAIVPQQIVPQQIVPILHTIVEIERTS